MNQVEFVRNIAGSPLAQVVADAHKHYGCGKPVGVVGAHPRGCVPAVGAAGHANSIGICYALVNEVIYTIHNVVELFAGKIGLAAKDKLNAAPGAAAIVRIENSVPFCCRHLAWNLVSGKPSIAVVRFRSAVYHCDDGNTISLAVANRVDHDAVDIKLSVAGGVADHFLAPQLHILEPLVVIGHFLRLSISAGSAHKQF